MAEVYRFSNLRDMAVKAQQRLLISEADLTRRSFRSSSERAVALRGLEAAKRRAKAVTEGTVDVVQYLLYVGIDFKGQLQMAYTAAGWGGSVDVSVNPFGVVGLNTELGVGAGIKGAKMRGLVVLRAPDEVELDGKVLRVPRPILVSSFVGGFWESKAQVGIDVSVGFSVEAGVLPKKGDAQAKSSADSSIDPDFGAKDDSPPATGFEALGCAAEAKIGAEASVGYVYDHFYAEDPFPLAYDDKAVAREKLGVILQEGSTKTMLKKDAIAFINRNTPMFGNLMQLHGTFLWHTTTTGHAEIIKRLDAGISKVKGRIRDEALFHRNNLQHYARAGDGSCFIRLSSHKADGAAGVYGSVGASAHAANLAKVGVEAKAFAGVKGNYKRSCGRLQTAYQSDPFSVRARSEAKPVTVHVTYDSVITYSSFFIGAEIDANAEGSLFGYSASAQDNEDFSSALDAINEAVQHRPDHLNQMTYRTAIAHWKRPEPSAASARLRGGQTKTETVDGLAGSGVCFGQTFTVGSLKRLCAHWDWNSGSFHPSIQRDPMVPVIAAALHCTKEDVLTFLRDDQVLTHLSYFFPDPSVGVMLEATFATPNLKFTVHRGWDAQAGHEVVQLDPNSASQMFDAPRTLESMRLRYRKRDVDDSDSSLFTCGFKILGTGFKIKLDKVERAGADGIVDVRTVFLDRGLKALSASGDAGQVQAYGKAVPPAALLCQ